MNSSQAVGSENPYASPQAGAAKRPGRSRWGRWTSVAATAVARIWVAFSVTACAGALFVAYVEREDLFRSDDAYTLGLAVAVFCTGFALLRGIAEVAGGSALVRRLAYFVPVVGVVALAVGYDAMHPSSDLHGLVTYCGTGIAAIGAATYPFVSARVSRVSLALLSIPGVLFLIGFGHVLAVMNAR